MNEKEKNEQFFKRTVGLGTAIIEAVTFIGMMALFIYICSVA